MLERLPREVWIVLAIDFLNSYRSFGFRSVQYQYLTKCVRPAPMAMASLAVTPQLHRFTCMRSEFALTDLETGQLLGIQAWLLVIFGFLGAMMVDVFGVRRTVQGARPTP